MEEEEAAAVKEGLFVVNPHKQKPRAILPGALLLRRGRSPMWIFECIKVSSGLERLKLWQYPYGHYLYDCLLATVCLSVIHFIYIIYQTVFGEQPSWVYKYIREWGFCTLIGLRTLALVLEVAKEAFSAKLRESFSNISFYDLACKLAKNIRVYDHQKPQKFVELAHTMSNKFRDKDSDTLFWYNSVDMLVRNKEYYQRFVNLLINAIEEEKIELDTLIAPSVTAHRLAYELGEKLGKGVSLADNKTMGFLPRFPCKGEKIVVVDDMVQTGDTIGRVKEAVEARGGIFVKAVCLIDNDLLEGKSKKILRDKIKVIFSMSNLFEIWKAQNSLLYHELCNKRNSPESLG